MGYRTVVILSNDEQHNWSKDPALGEKIASAAWKYHTENSPIPGYGCVAQVAHADVQTLAVIDSLSLSSKTFTIWNSKQTEQSRDLELLRGMAKKLGYRLVKRTTKQVD